MPAQAKKEIYRNFHQKRALPIFVQDWYLDAVCLSGHWDFVFVKKNGVVVGVLPYFLKQKLGFSYITMPIGAKYMGPFLLPEQDNIEDQHRIYEKLIQQLPKVDSFRQNFYPSVNNWLPFYWDDFQQTTQYTYRLNVESLEEVYRGFSKKTKYRIRKAEKVVHVSEGFSAKQFHEVHEMTFNRQGLKTPQTLNEFLAFDAILEQQKARKIFFAIDDDKQIHAAIYILLDKDIAYIHFMGSNPIFQKSEAITLLFWHVIQYVNKNHSIHLIDFEGSMMKNVENLCRRVKAVQAPYFSITRDDSTLFKMIKRVKK